MTERRIDRGVLARRHTHRCLVVPVIVHVGALDETRENTIHRRIALGQDRNHQNRRSQEELPIRAGQRGIVGEFPRQSAHDGVAVDMRVVEQRVQVRQELEAHGHGRLGRVDHTAPHVCFLRVCRQHVVVAVEREEGAQLHPAVTQFFVAVAIKPARVDAEHGDPKETEAQSLRDREVHVVELGFVVAAPMPCHGPRAGECRAADDEGPFRWSGRQERSVCRLQDLMAEKVVHVVFHDPVVVRCVRRHGVHGQIALDMVDNVRRVVDVAYPWRRRGTQIARRGGRR